MKSFAAMTGQEKAIFILRWICVLPAAALAGSAAKYVGVVGWLVPGASFAHPFMLLRYFCWGGMFVVAGSLTAPSKRLATSAILAAIAMSLVTHIVSQNHPGIANYTHLATELIGAACGIAFIRYLERRSLPRQ